MRDSVKRNILLNPGPATTTDTVKYAQVVPDICPREKEFGLLMTDIRKKLVRVIHGEDRYTAIPFTASGTGVVEACISSVLPEGKKIFIINNGAYGKRMIEIARCYYEETKILTYEIPWGDYPNVSEIEHIIEKEKYIGVITVVHHETTTGMLNPVNEINRIAHLNNIDIIVDAMSSYAGIVIDLREDDYDYIISSSNKCIQGMPGIGFVICKKEKLERTKDNPRRNYYFNLWHQYRFFEDKNQMQFTPPVQTAYALNQALNEFFEETGEMRHQRYNESWQTLIEGLENLNLRFLVPDEQQSRLLIAVIEPENENYIFEEMHDYLFRRGFTIYPGKGAEKNTFRIANIGAIDKDDITRFLAALEDYLKSISFINKYN